MSTPTPVRDDSDANNAIVDDAATIDCDEDQWFTPAHAEVMNGWNDVAVEFPQTADFVCPLSSRVMVDPVKAEDGFTYERATIEQWLETHDTSPQLPGTKMGKTLLPDDRRRVAIRAFLAVQANPEARRAFTSHPRVCTVRTVLPIRNK